MNSPLPKLPKRIIISTTIIYIAHLLDRITSYNVCYTKLLRISAQALRESAVKSRTHHIPIIYGGEWGPDLEGVADFAKLSLAETIRLHCSVSYRVYMLGFSPGFPYMGIVPERIAMPRLATPRLAVPAGSVGIADTQTGIYPIGTPGGWRLIGRTPIQLYRPGSGVPFLIKPGDWVRFEPITVQDFNRLLLAHHAETHRITSYNVCYTKLLR